MFYQIKDKHNAQTFKNVINEGNIIVLYYADWCGYCQRFKPVWEELKKKLKSNKPMCHIGEVESANMHYLPDVEVSSYPTILFYKPKTRADTKDKSKSHYTTPDEKPKIEKKLNSFQDLIQNMMSPQMNTEGESAKDNVVPFDGEDRTIKNLLTFIRKNTNDTSSKSKFNKVSNNLSTRSVNNLSKKIAMTKLLSNKKGSTKRSKKGSTKRKKKGSTKKRRVSKSNSGESSLKKYKRAKKEDKKLKLEIMNSFKTDL